MSPSHIRFKFCFYFKATSFLYIENQYSTLLYDRSGIIFVLSFTQLLWPTLSTSQVWLCLFFFHLMWRYTQRQSWFFISVNNKKKRKYCMMPILSTTILSNYGESNCLPTLNGRSWAATKVCTFYIKKSEVDLGKEPRKFASYVSISVNRIHFIFI